MAVIFPDEINNQKDDDLRKRIDTLYDYVDYMKEMLEFWGKNRQTDIRNNGTSITQTEGEIKTMQEILAPPSADGTYTLSVTVADGNVTYTWE